MSCKYSPISCSTAKARSYLPKNLSYLYLGILVAATLGFFVSSGAVVGIGLYALIPVLASMVVMAVFMDRGRRASNNENIQLLVPNVSNTLFATPKDQKDTDSPTETNNNQPT